MTHANMVELAVSSQVVIITSLETGERRVVAYEGLSSKLFWKTMRTMIGVCCSEKATAKTHEFVRETLCKLALGLVADAVESKTFKPNVLGLEEDPKWLESLAAFRTYTKGLEKMTSMLVPDTFEEFIKTNPN